MRRGRDIKAFVDSLANAELPDDLIANIYTCDARRANLLRWFEGFEDLPGSAIFVGAEAGQKGAAITGVPFVSSQVITAGGDPWSEFGFGRGYVVPAGSRTDQAETTATRFWRYVAPQLKGLPRPLVWNTYPFWTYCVGDGGQLKNRGANKHEIEVGKRWLRWVLQIFPRARVVASGDQAKKTLKSMGFEHLKMPHPAARIKNTDLISASKEIARVLRSDLNPK